MFNSDDNQNNGKITGDSLLRVLSHVFFISLIIVSMFAITAVVNTMTQRAYQAEPLTIEENQTHPLEKKDMPGSSSEMSQVPPILSYAVSDALSHGTDGLHQSTEKKSGKKNPSKKQVTRLSGEELGFHVTGIIISKEGNRAVITGKNGKSYMICTGEKIGKWFVDSIDKTQVLLKTDGYVALLKPSAGCRSLKMPVKDEFEGVMGIDDEDPGFRLTGILKNDREINAILTGLDGKNYTVKPGQVVGRWTVSFITDKMVFLKNNKTMTIAVLELNPPSQNMEEMKHQEHFQDVMVL